MYLDLSLSLICCVIWDSVVVWIWNEPPKASGAGAFFTCWVIQALRLDCITVSGLHQYNPSRIHNLIALWGGGRNPHVGEFIAGNESLVYGFEYVHTQYNILCHSTLTLCLGLTSVSISSLLYTFAIPFHHDASALLRLKSNAASWQWRKLWI